MREPGRLARLRDRMREPGRLARLRDRMPGGGRERYHPRLPATLLRGAVRLAAVVIAAGLIGTLLGMALSKLM